MRLFFPDTSRPAYTRRKPSAPWQRSRPARTPASSTTPPALVARINDLLRQAVDAADTRERMRVQGVTPELLSPEQFREKVKSEIESWAPVIERSGMKGSL